MSDGPRRALAECVGTFGYCVIGAGAIVADSFLRGGVGLIGIALAHGLILAVLFSSLAQISGGHFNPAITLGLRVVRKVDSLTAALYIGAQLLGAALAGVALRLVFDPGVWGPVYLGTPVLAPEIAPLAGLAIEGLLTFFLMLAMLGTSVDSMAPKLGGFAIGLTVSAGMLMGAPFTGAAMNPARAFGPGLVAGIWEFQWVYWVGPIAGAALAALLYTRTLSKTI